MDLIGLVFVWFVVIGLFLAALSIIGIVVEHAAKQEKECFDDVEGIKRVFKEEDK